MLFGSQDHSCLVFKPFSTNSRTKKNNQKTSMFLNTDFLS